MAYAIVEKTGGTTVGNSTLVHVTDLDQVTASAGGVWDNGQACFVTPTGVTNVWHEVSAIVDWGDEQAGAHLVEALVNTTRWPLAQHDGDWSANATTGLVQAGQVYVKLSAGDTVKLRVRQISGTSQTLNRVVQFSVRAVTL